MTSLQLSTASTVLQHLLGSGSFSDLTLVCDGREIQVHKAIVCPQSPVLAAAISGEYEVGQRKKPFRT